MTKFRYECPKCGHGITLQLSLPKGDTPRYPPTCQNEEKHHSNRVFQMELK